MELLLEQVRELWSERRRVVWVALGVAWGTLSLTLLLAFGSSFVTATHGTIDNFGKHLLRIGGGSTTIPHAGMPAGRFIPLDLDDADALRAGVPEARSVEVEYSSGGANPIRFGDVRVNAPLSGCGFRYQEMRGMVPQDGGRFFNRNDIEEHRRVCFLGHRTKARLFGSEPAVGRTVKIHGTPFLVVGVRQERIAVSSYNGDDRDKVAIPHTAFADLLGWTRPSFLMVGLTDDDVKEEALDSIYRILSTTHQFDAADEDALDIQDYLAMTDMIHGMLNGNRIFNGIVGIFGLLVAVLGVMNMMYVMVEQRRREIGVRMALGARPREIHMERIVEAVSVTLTGGIVGMVACAGLFALLDMAPLDAEARAYMGYPSMSLTLGVIVTLILTFAGCVAGWFPARRAAALDPVETLREE
ncbi:MAG: ABC transporter permease [Planctomycetota bacterium]|jgi:putative ABC transport system permease protein